MALPLDPAVAVRSPPTTSPPSSRPFDLVTAMPGFDWPTAVICGGRDLITAAVADRIAGLIPDAALVRLPDGRAQHPGHP